jgi:Rod binding domain-containing protein
MAGVDPALLAGCQQFEAVMLRPLLEQLRFGRGATDAQSADAGSDDSGAADLVRSMFVDALSLALVRAGGFGLAREFARALSDRRP